MGEQVTDEEAREKFWELIKDMGTAMMTTVDDGVLRARPMRGHQDAFNGTLWFFTKVSSHKASEIGRLSQVNLTYVDQAKERYVSVSGHAELVFDRLKFKALWNAFTAAWFPDGVDDPDLALIKVTVEQAEYWDGPSSKMVQLWRLAKAKLTGEAPDLGENEKITVAE